ncbi:oligosaccharide flippase family protein [Rosenbergiella epipactidis]|uniref:oligosaccharide flippase family protein n=1 Tax=Rosenbergiella epipactidis TaxID=1544694 RepID=UPI001F4FE419|nr:oligosaccharide flippase family protein [Rosenbergiella epipactidis]
MKNIKNVAYMLVVQLSNYAFPLITIPIVSRVFGPEKIGLINYISAIIIYFSMVVNYSFNYTGVRRLTRNENDGNKIFSTIFFTQLLLLLISSFFFFLCLFFISDLRDNALLSLVTFCTCISSLFTQNWFLQSKNDFKFIAVTSFVVKLATFFLILLLIRNSNDLFLYSCILNGINLLFSIVTFLIIISKYKISIRFPGCKICLTYLKEDKYLFLSSVVTSLYTTTGIVLLGFLSNKVEVGLYSSAQRLIDVFKSILLMPISQIIFPILSQKFGKDKREGLDAIKKIMPLFIMITFFSIVFINVFRMQFVIILFGSQFYSMIDILTVLSFGLFFVFYGVLIGGQVMLNLSMDKAFLNIQIIISIISLIINSLLIPAGGGIVTAYVWTFSEFIITTYQVMYLRQKGINVFSLNMISLHKLKESLQYVLKKS